MSLAELIEISDFYGSDPEFVLAGGGNTSYKDDKYLYIKGSGTTLAGITAEGFVAMDRAALAAMWQKEYPEDNAEREARVLEDLMSARGKSEAAKRPSVETSLHDLFPQRFVVHTHPALINGLTCGKNGEKAVAELFSDTVIWIEETKPGFTLALKVRKEVIRYKAQHNRMPEIVFLQNHGVFVAADTTDRIRQLYEQIINRISLRIKRKPDFSPVSFDRERAAALAPALRMILMGDRGYSILTFRTNREVGALVESEEAFRPVSLPYSPDHIVYCRHKAVFLNYFEDVSKQREEAVVKIAAYKDENGFMPKIIAVQKLGIFAWGKNKKEADIAADLFMDAVKITAYSSNFGGQRYLSGPMIDFIINWEVESYRQKVMATASRPEKLAGRISVITGSAQGFGKGIAEEMADAGSYIVVADLNYGSAAQNASELCRIYGKGRATALKVDVGDEAQVKDMIIDTVLEYGGLDIFVSNAGILKAGGLDEMDLKNFELITKINYTAYFLCVKYASEPMKIQHAFMKDYFMDIIQINSKSGLAGSNRNFAYAGGKFGGIGLTQSFALELVGFRIKVNSICPGNLLGGPLWSDPDKGLFVQYLRAGKVPGAKTADDVRKFYEDKVPMGRGCEIKDVARAIFYVIEQEYETGQAVPVTGGQNMLHA